ncbi:flagellar biosynthesis protein FlhF [Bacillus benzoevorans]|uniref:Flagellar biosynthesis protein FlhF n=1 Tax=Bacillus benzoevorans TaxID=1456 RepID=A0A7X0LTG0_9BACI|nr:flagellar biosynthesis protein FlhF [Bacillus benzoevorans]MBB6443861.1 flagellar biosynthesis protein FlhF [Bacillus benzoevorans]
MKVKKYRASTMPEAMKLIRSDLGNDAIILNSRVIQTNGFLGFFKKRSIEVIAALDEKPFEMVQQMKPDKRKAVAIPTASSKTSTEKTAEMKEERETEELRKEISELKLLLSGVVERNDKEVPPLPVPIQKMQQLLLKQEIKELVVETIVNDAMKWWIEAGESKSEAEVLMWAKEHMMMKISHLPFSDISFTKKFITVVGPTGVGKTTTLAKMAAECILKHKKKVAFITTDTYRIAAIEQLKTYANILNVPIEVCYNMEDFQKAVTQFENYDVVFIDTAGRNFRNPANVADLQKNIDFSKGLETFLVLSLTSKQMDMEEIYHQFDAVHIDKIILTKADETSTFGAMFNIMYSWQKPVAYITNGQNVPDDIISATPEKVVKCLIGVN